MISKWLPMLFMALWLPVRLSPATPAAPRPIHYVVAVHGEVQILRKGCRTWTPVLARAAAERGDLLRLENGARLTLVCADLKKHELAGPQETGLPCIQVRPVLVHGSEAWSPTRGGNHLPEGFPVVLAPRRTRVRDSHPLLRWTAVPGVSSYVVRVRGDGVDWSTNLDARTEMVYPDTAPALVPGSTYRVVVSVEGRSSEEEGQSGLGFTLLSAEDRKSLDAEVERVRSLGLESEATRFLLASLHASLGLRSAAIDELEAFGTPPPDSAIARTLGGLYAEAGLARRAEESYLLALRLSRDGADPEGEGAALEQLGRFYDLVLGNRSEAASRWREAAAVYRKLGDAQAVKRLEDRIGALGHPGTKKEG